MEQPLCWTIQRVLNWTIERFSRAPLDSPRLDAEVLLAHELGCPRMTLYTDFDRPLGASELAGFRALIKRRLAGEPVAYITGTREFFSLPLKVDRRVLIPRPETELLVELATTLGPRDGTVVDLCTGSGAVALALARERPDLHVMATDISPDALAVARENAQALSLDLELYEGDLFDALPETLRPDLVVSNPPYVAHLDLERVQREVRDFEPRVALDGGPDGLVVIRRLAAGAEQRLPSGGRLLVEIGSTQGPAVSAYLSNLEFSDIQIYRDLAGLDRVVGACRR